MKPINNIPNLTGSSYTDTYLKEDIGVSQKPTKNVQHFEFHHKCDWKNVIPLHRLDFYMVVLVTSGEGIHTIGTHDHYIRKNTLCFIGPNMVTSWQSGEGEQRGYYCSFSADFFNLGLENKDYISDLPFFSMDGCATMPLSDEQMQYFESLFKMIKNDSDTRNNYNDQILQNCLRLIMSKAAAYYYEGGCMMSQQANNARMRILKSFMNEYRKEFVVLQKGGAIEQKKISYYADAIGVSQNHLNDTVKAVTGKSAGQLIRDEMVHYATVCLKHSTKSIAEIAYQLGYEDPAYFSRLYKTETGISPSSLR